MESKLEIWKGRISGWKVSKVILKENILYVSKKGKIDLKISMRISSINEMRTKPLEFKIYTGTKDLYLRTTTPTLKNKWINAMKLSQEESASELEKIKAIKKVLSNKNYGEHLDKEIKFLISDKETNVLNDKIAILCDKNARLKEQLSNFTDIANERQKKYITNIVKLGESLKKYIHECLIIIEEEKGKLIVVNEVFRKRLKQDPKIKNNNEKNKSFRYELEKILEEKSKIVNKDSIYIEDDDEKSSDHFKSFNVNTDEFMKAQNSILLKRKQILIEPEEKKLQEEKIITVVTEKQLDKKIETLLKTNEVFQKFPISECKSRIRENLPVKRDMNVKLNIWSILKENIGRDLTRITMPIYFNEPLNMLQKTICFIEYKELFNKANKTKDKYLQCGYILSAFFIIYANTIGTTKKPFNPLLGETFELYEPNDKTFRMFTEQVSHHPPISAFWGENEHFIAEGHMSTKTDFSHKGIKIKPIGETIITLKSTGDRFKISKPVTSVHNFIFGKMYVWNSGEMSCTNLNTGDKAILMLEPKGWTSKNDYEAEGKIVDRDGNTKYSLYGKWNSFATAINPENHEEIKLVEIIESPKDKELQYFFSKWNINLNNNYLGIIDELPSTDSRFRTDMRAYEYGALKLAANEKHRLEESQRARRKLREQNKVTWNPKWFNFVIENKMVKECKYNGRYWEAKKNKKWPEDLMDLYN